MGKGAGAPSGEGRTPGLVAALGGGGGKLEDLAVHRASEREDRGLGADPRCRGRAIGAHLDADRVVVADHARGVAVLAFEDGGAAAVGPLEHGHEEAFEEQERSQKRADPRPRATIGSIHCDDGTRSGAEGARKGCGSPCWTAGTLLPIFPSRAWGAHLLSQRK